MLLPNYQELLMPVLNSFKGNEELSISQIRDRVAKSIRLTNEQLREKYSSGVPVFLNQAGWAILCLYNAGLLRRVRRGIYQLTKSGKTLQGENREAIDVDFLHNRYSAYRKWRQTFGRKTQAQARTKSDDTDQLSDPLTPLAQLEEAREKIEHIVKSDLYKRMQEEISPSKLERIAVDLVKKIMGYGENHADSARVTGGPNDGGIDGVIKEDALGLSKIYIQAKKYAAKYTVSSGKVREFAEALNQRNAKKGVFVTTSKFAPSAKKAYGERDDIALIDCEELVRLMIQYEVGVTRKDYAIKRIDENYFAEEEL